VSVTAADINWLNESGIIVALGSENGEVGVWSLKPQHGEGMEAVRLACVESQESHGMTVQRIRWSPVQQHAQEFRLATVGDDHSVRVLIFRFSC
jgi:hypothetical protein